LRDRRRVRWPYVHRSIGVQRVLTNHAEGTVAIMFKPAEVPVIPTPDKLLEACRRGKADYMFTVPSHCEEWSHDNEAIRQLTQLKTLIYGGGPLAQETGDRLIKAGVNITNGYGTTETGIIFSMRMKKEDPMDWMYGEIYPSRRVSLVPEGNNLYRLIILDCDEHPIAVSNHPHLKAFDTNDLLEQHPTKKNLWKIIGRADDQLMMSNGEKTNPGPLENIISGNPNVKTCMMFGRGKTQVGIAIEPAAHVDTTNEAALAEFRNLIWPDIEKANGFAPQHSRIFKEFILVIDPSIKPFVKTPKATLSRNASLLQFAEEIDALYEAAEQPTKAEWAEPPAAWDEAALHSFVVRVVNGVMRDGDMQAVLIDEGRDLFEQGCDSLQATYIRAAITNALRLAPKPEGKSDIAATSVPQNLVFTYSTVKRLVAYISKAIGAVARHHVYEDDERAVATDNMNAMIKKYSHDFPVHLPGKRSTSGEVVLLTGSTGTLGTYLLELLLLDERVERVYAVNRSSVKHDLVTRQREAFVDRGVDVQLLDSPKLRLIETDVTKENLGFSAELFAEVCQSLSTIIHNAWRLDFNLSLSAFEQNVRASRSLVDLALQVTGPTPAQLIFTSSIGTLMKWGERRPVPEEPISDPIIASGSGYSESKWVAERIMLAAVEQGGLRTTIWRVGQLAGSEHNGAWNTTDWLPMLVKSGETLKVLPSLPGSISWLPSDKAAQSILDAMHGFAMSPSGVSEYLHLVHPNPVQWDDILNPLAAEMSCTLVPFSKWLNALEEAAEDHKQVECNPAIKLLEFYRGIAVAEVARGEGDDGAYKTKEAMGIADLKTTKAEEKSQTLKTLQPLGQADAYRWMAYWHKHGLFV